MDRTTIRRSVAVWVDYLLALATRYQMLGWPTPTCPGRRLGGQRTGVDDGHDKRERPAGTLTRVVFCSIRALAHLFACALDSDVDNSSELTLVPDSTYNKALVREEFDCTASSVPHLEYLGRPISGSDMGLPSFTTPMTQEEFYRFNSPPITYSPGPLKFYVPVELFQLILENIDTSYGAYTMLMKRLRLVSRTWRFEADRYHYRNVSIAEGHFVDFARTLLAYPRRAWYIHSLRVDWGQEAAVTPEHRDIIRRAFMIMPNLVTLTERIARGNPLFVSNEALVLRGAPFRLRTWDTCFRWCPELEELLLEQTEIRNFKCHGDLSFGTGPPEQRLARPGILPRCTLMDAGPGILQTFQNVGDVPSMRHLTFRVDALNPNCELVAAPQPRFIGAQLTSLVISRNSIPTCEFTPIPELIREFIASVPNLLLFGVIDGQILTPRDNAQIRAMVCDHLPHLRTFLWAQNVQGWAEVEELDEEDMQGDDVDSDDSDEEQDEDEEDGENEPQAPRRRLNRHEKFGLYAKKFFADHPTLEYVSAYFHRPVDPNYIVIYPDSEPTQSLYKRIWDDKIPSGYTVVEDDNVYPVTNTKCDLVDPRAPEDFLVHNRVNPNRFIAPNPALPALSTDSDSD